MYPQQSGDGFPTKYKLKVSVDGNARDEVASVDKGEKSGEAREFTFEAQNASYIKLSATILTLESNANAGYVLELYELEAYWAE